MTIVLIIIGAIAGAIVADVAGREFFGAVAGGALAWLLTWSRARAQRLEARFRSLELQLHALERKPAPEPAPASEQEQEIVPAPAPLAEQVAMHEPAVFTNPPAPEPQPTPARITDRLFDDSPAAPAEPSPVTALLARLAGGNPVVRIGIVVLFFGVAFLFKYAYDRVHIPMALRLIGVALAAIAMLAVGWRLRERRPDYGLVLQGGGVGLLYLTVFAALKLTAIMPAGLAFALLVAIVAFSAVLAVAQDSLALAVLGVAGGFLAPVLASTGAGSHVMLFSYYAVLNAGILAIAWKRAWRGLNLLGFVFTFVIATAWGVLRYHPEHYASTQPFLVLFFLFYVGVALLYARNQAPRLAHYVDGTLVFGVPVVAFGLQAGLVRHIEFATAASSAAFAAFYVGLAAYLLQRSGKRLKLLVESFLALGIVFATLAIPLALEARFTATAWALEGAAIAWIGLRQRRLLACAFGYFLQFAAGTAFGFGHHGSDVDFLGFLFLAAAGLITAHRIHRTEGLDPWERAVGQALFVWGVLWWLAGGWHELDRLLATRLMPNALLIFVALSAAALSFAARRLAWPLAARSTLAFAPILAGHAIAAVFELSHPLAYLGWIAWPFALAVHLWILHRHEDESPGIARVLHPLGLWISASIASWELGWQVDQLVAEGRIWGRIAWALVPCAMIGLATAAASRIEWPMRTHLRAYLLYGAAPIAVFLVVWSIAANFGTNGDPRPLPYVPLVNPLDLALAAIVLSLLAWLKGLERHGIAYWLRDRPYVVWGAVGAIALLAVNASLLRTLHFWAGVPFDWDAMLHSRLVQAALSILWTTIALIATVGAHRLGIRALWTVGAGLLAVVALKLFFVDFATHGVERIVSFIGVGLIMVAIGYFAPLPPKRAP